MTDVTTLSYVRDETTLTYTVEVTSIDAAGLGPLGPAFEGGGTLAIVDGGTGADNAADARTNLGLGTAAVVDTSYFDAAGAAAAAQSASQPVDSDLTAIAALSTTSFGRALLALADAAALRSAASLGSIATQAASNVTITGGSVTGITDLAVADGGTGGSDAATARSNLGLVIGTNVQAYDAELAALAGLTSAADKGIQFTGSGTAATYDLTTAGKALLDDADASAQRTTLGLGSIATQASSNVTITGGSVTGITDVAIADGGTGASTAANARTNLGVDTPRDAVYSGCVWTADAAGSTRVASMTAGTVLVSGVFVTVSAVTSRTFTASRDTYVDVDTSGTLTYTEVTNNNTSPALASNNVRLAIVVTGASSIAAQTSINQGNPISVLPIASSVPYCVTDSIGNLIYPKPGQRLLGYRQIVSNYTTSTTTVTDITGLSAVPFIAPANPGSSLVKMTLYTPVLYSSAAAGTQITAQIRTSGGFALQSGFVSIPNSNQGAAVTAETLQYVSPGAQTVKGSTLAGAAGTLGFFAGSSTPAFLAIELQ